MELTVTFYFLLTDYVFGLSIFMGLELLNKCLVEMYSLVHTEAILNR